MVMTEKYVLGMDIKVYSVKLKETKGVATQPLSVSMPFQEIKKMYGSFQVRLEGEEGQG